MSRLRIVQLFGDLLGTYGDNGNGMVLHRRATWRDIDATLVDVRAGEPVPDDGDIYVIGGGEDGPQTRAARMLADSGALGRAVDRGAAVLAVCAGFQVLGYTFTGPDGVVTPGLGLLDVTSTRAEGARVVGEIVVDSSPDLVLGPLTGYENHARVTTLGPAATPLGRVRVGVGNGDVHPEGGRFEGARQDRIIGTYLHGPVLARNPDLADLLLGWATGRVTDELESLDDTTVEALRAERIARAPTERGGHTPTGARSILRSLRARRRR